MHSWLCRWLLCMMCVCMHVLHACIHVHIGMYTNTKQHAYYNIVLQIFCDYTKLRDNTHSLGALSLGKKQVDNLSKHNGWLTVGLKHAYFDQTVREVTWPQLTVWRMHTWLCHGRGHGHGVFILATHPVRKWTTNPKPSSVHTFPRAHTHTHTHTHKEYGKHVIASVIRTSQVSHSVAGDMRSMRGGSISHKILGMYIELTRLSAWSQLHAKWDVTNAARCFCHVMSSEMAHFSWGEIKPPTSMPACLADCVTKIEMQRSLSDGHRHCIFV